MLVFGSGPKQAPDFLPMSSAAGNDNDSAMDKVGCWLCAGSDTALHGRYGKPPMRWVILLHNYTSIVVWVYGIDIYIYILPYYPLVN